jgi:SAM-dependent methyltransferase
MVHPTWDESYAAGNLPWDIGHPEPMLVDFIESGRISPGRALEVGCGTGNDARWLAGRGFDVLGVDVSPLAVEQANTKLAGAALRCRFQTLDILGDEPLSGPFDFVFDRGCFHVFDEDDERARFAARVAAALAPGGVWLSLLGSTEGPPREYGPPRRTAREVVAAIEPVLEILELCSRDFGEPHERAKAWFCLSGRRAVPAQPSTR